MIINEHIYYGYNQITIIILLIIQTNILSANIFFSVVYFYILNRIIYILLRLLRNLSFLRHIFLGLICIFPNIVCYISLQYFLLFLLLNIIILQKLTHWVIILYMVTFLKYRHMKVKMKLCSIFFFLKNSYKKYADNRVNSGNKIFCFLDYFLSPEQFIKARIKQNILFTCVKL